MALAHPLASSPSALPLTLDDDDDYEDNNLASLMPHFCTKLNDNTITELDFQEIHRFLSLETSKEKVLPAQAGSLTNQPLATYCKRKDRDAEKDELEASQTSSPLARREYQGGKENATPRKVRQRHAFSRREGSSRITSHRTFKVDLRSFGSILNNGVLGDSQIPCDVHAFWEAEDEREASEAIMRKLQGEAEPCSQQSVLGNLKLRRPYVRRKGSQRRTKSRCITFDLPLYAKEVQLLDDEQLEEEDANLDSYTFVNKSELKMKDDTNTNKSIAIPFQNSQHVNADLIHSEMVKSSISPPYEIDKPSAQLCNDDDMQIVLPDGESPILHTNNDGRCMPNQEYSIVSKTHPNEDLKGLPTVLQPLDKMQVSFNEHTAASVNSSAADKKEGYCDDEAKFVLEEHTEEASVFVNSSAHDEEEVHIDAGAVLVSMSTAYTKELPVEEETAFVSESAAHKNEVHVAEDEEVCVGAAINVTPYKKNELQKKLPLTSPTPPSNPLAVFGFRKDIVPEDIGKRKLDFDSTMDNVLLEPALPTSTGKDLPCLEKSSPSSGKSAQECSPELRKESKSVSFKDVAGVNHSITAQYKQLEKVHKKSNQMRNKTANRRSSLAASGTKWENGVRRSTRIRSRPLDFWRGERFLYGRVHKSLTTVIGIKYSSPPPCWPRGDAACPKFKVESFVSDKYADYVQFAARC